MASTTAQTFSSASGGDSDFARLPKAELHVHIEGTLRPALMKTLAARNGVEIDPGIFAPDGQNYNYNSFLDLVTRVYQSGARAMVTRDDYREVTNDYLQRCAAEGSLYEELIGYPGQCQVSPISYRDMVDGIADGIDQARAETGILSRVNMAFERHRPGAEAEGDADLILSYPHPYIVGVDIAGGEQEGDIPAFLPTVARLRRDYGAPLGMRMHAGENCGPRNLRDAIDAGVTRIGHGVRVTEDAGLMREVADRGIVLEVCPTSNLYLMPKYAGDLHNHPLRQIYDAGIKVTINSDDPGMFGAACTIGGEYRLARDVLGFNDAELRDVTRTAIEAAYLPEAEKSILRRRIVPVDAAVPALGLGAPLP